jgi:hypothetical protein
MLLWLLYHNFRLLITELNPIEHLFWHLGRYLEDNLIPRLPNGSANCNGEGLVFPNLLILIHISPFVQRSVSAFCSSISIQRPKPFAYNRRLWTILTELN